MTVAFKNALPVGPPQGVPRDAGRTIARMSKMLRLGRYSVEATFGGSYTVTLSVKDVDGEPAAGDFIVAIRLVYTGTLTVTESAGTLIQVGTDSGEATFIGYTNSSGQIVFTTGQATSNQITVTSAVIEIAKQSDTRTWS